MQAIKEPESQAERLAAAWRGHSHQKSAMQNKDYATGPAVFVCFVFFFVFSAPADVTGSHWASGSADQAFLQPSRLCTLTSVQNFINKSE